MHPLRQAMKNLDRAFQNWWADGPITALSSIDGVRGVATMNEDPEGAYLIVVVAALTLPETRGKALVAFE
jgi:hypothetical protein